VSTLDTLVQMDDARVSAEFTKIVDRYVKSLVSEHNNKGIPKRGFQPSVRVEAISRKKGQLIPSEALMAIREAIWKRGWTQGELITPEGKMCLRGGFVYLYQKNLFTLADGLIAMQYLRDEIRMKNGDNRDWNFIYWNNEPRRTLADVLRVLENCANRARLAGE
jgi:hypothetical protein